MGVHGIVIVVRLDLMIAHDAPVEGWPELTHTKTSVP